MPFILKKNKECFLSWQREWSIQIMEGGLWGDLKWQYILIWQTSQCHWMTLLPGPCLIPVCPTLHASPVMQPTAQPFYCLRHAKPCRLNDLSKSLFSDRFFCSQSQKSQALLLCALWSHGKLNLYIVFECIWMFQAVQQRITYTTEINGIYACLHWNDHETAWNKTMQIYLAQ